MSTIVAVWRCGGVAVWRCGGVAGNAKRGLVERKGLRVCGVVADGTLSAH